MFDFRQSAGGGIRTQLLQSDIDLIVSLAGCSLDEKPGSNWV